MVSFIEVSIYVIPLSNLVSIAHQYTVQSHPWWSLAESKPKTPVMQSHPSTVVQSKLRVAVAQ